ncbi:MAG TPA: hypothetical protein VF062_03105, partial [Candidatus Limnocylindrales bacterium]
MSMFGGGFGGPGGGPGSAPMGGLAAGPRGGAHVKANEGLPFAGVPPELAAGVLRLEQGEPVHPEPNVTFDH